jgi:hypothetical protein
MNFLLFFTARFNLCPTIFQLPPLLFLLVLGIQYHLVLSYNSIMPVTTRSKSFLLTQSTTGSLKVSNLSTSSSSEPLEALNLLTNSTNESSKVTSTSKPLPSEFYLPDEHLY